MQTETSVAALVEGPKGQSSADARSIDPVAIDLPAMARLMHTSTGTVRRCMAEDPAFPATFQYRRNGERYLLVADALDYILSKARAAREAR